MARGPARPRLPTCWVGEVWGPSAGPHLAASSPPDRQWTRVKTWFASWRLCCWYLPTRLLSLRPQWDPRLLPLTREKTEAQGRSNGTCQHPAAGSHSSPLGPDRVLLTPLLSPILHGTAGVVAMDERVGGRPAVRGHWVRVGQMERETAGLFIRRERAGRPQTGPRGRESPGGSLPLRPEGLGGRPQRACLRPTRLFRALISLSFFLFRKA